ncbi:MAG: glucose-6-phosphate dehydrogenase assembly protein OpcA [Ancrocorticia sp.]|jgi:glucose-6-phosphate dehydrogenase assembly protein OpcA|nr:glucose-6-phosphate dehydrogenase assembly protein OpcA [Ancrocorticia sp.]MCI2193575.1 glucose-6-phosphate dehydrogenase assembly protein OpcA [Ancrocorticia sp.]
MIIQMNNTSSAAVGLRLDELRDTVGSVALGRVLTLVIIARDESGIHDGIEAAAGASQAHPCRIVAVLSIPAAEPRVDAEVRVGPEAGLSEIAILRCYGHAYSNLDSLITPLILPDTPIFAWWVQSAPSDVSASTIGAMADRRITSSLILEDPAAALMNLRSTYAPGDTDLAWAGVTLWRNHLAALLDEQPDEPITHVCIEGSLHHASTYLLGAWLALRLHAPVEFKDTRSPVIDVVRMERSSGDLVLDRPGGSNFADMCRPGRSKQRVNLPVRSLRSMLIEELREATADTAYADVLHNGLPLLDYPDTTVSE